MNSLLLILFLGTSLVLVEVAFASPALDKISDDEGNEIMDEFADKNDCEEEKEECEDKERDRRDDEEGNKKCGDCYKACLEGKKPPMCA